MSVPEAGIHRLQKAKKWDDMWATEIRQKFILLVVLEVLLFTWEVRKDEEI